ncbi:MAG: hypothetical protein JO130_10310 [Solirubrobacterales bacterium]|nr:hypothetical protein [Solirubrobacterales bacterium]
MTGARRILAEFQAPAFGELINPELSRTPGLLRRFEYNPTMSVLARPRWVR